MRNEEGVQSLPQESGYGGRLDTFKILLLLIFLTATLANYPFQ